MSKNLIIGLIVALLILVGGAGAFFVLNNNDDSSNTESTASSNEQLPFFNPAATAGESFVATMTGTTEDKSYTATIEYDGSGNAHYTGQFEDETFELYMLGERNIICNGGQCIETPNTTGASPVDRDLFDISDEDLTEYRNNALYQGTQDCPAGKCEVWQISVEDYTGLLFVSEDGQISKATGEAAGGSFEIIYSYEQVTVSAPENIQTIPLLQ